MKSTRQEVYEAIDSEREYQNTVVAERFNRQFDKTDSLGGHLCLLQDYYVEAIHAWAREEGDEPALRAVRKLAGIVTRCLEQIAVPLWTIGSGTPSADTARYMVYLAFEDATFAPPDPTNRIGDFICYIRTALDEAVGGFYPPLDPLRTCKSLVLMGLHCIEAMENLGAYKR